MLVLPDRSLVTIDEGATVVGRGVGDPRSPEPDVDLGPFDGEQLVSRAHLELRFVDGVLTVRDLGSTNGTQMEGMTLIPGRDYPLGPGDAFTVGDSQLRIAVLHEESSAGERTATEPSADARRDAADPVTRTLPEAAEPGEPEEPKVVASPTATIIGARPRPAPPPDDAPHRKGALDRFLGRADR